MKQILINYLSMLNEPRDDKNYYYFDLPGDKNDRVTFEGFQTNEPIVRYCALSAKSKDDISFDHIIAIRSEDVETKSCLIEKVKLEQNSNLWELELKEYLDVDDGGKPIIVNRKIESEQVPCYSIQHYKYFEKNLKQICEEYEYGEDEIPKIHTLRIKNRPMDADVRDMIVQVGDTVAECVNGDYKDYRLVLDCTGGDRSTAVMMIALTKMLEERGFRDIKLLGTNFFYGSTPDNRCTVCYKAEMSDIFDLITGTRIFLDYGDAKALMKFFDKIDLSNQNKNVLKAIQGFSDALTLCNVDRIGSKLTDMIGKINTATKDGKSKEDRDYDSSLFRYVMSEIKEDLRKMSDNVEKTDLDIIKWCLRKGMVQQAVALYTERIPIAMVKQGIIGYKKSENWDIVDKTVTAWKQGKATQLTVYKDDLHNKLIYSDFRRSNLKYREDKKKWIYKDNLRESPYSEEMNFFNSYLWFTDKRENGFLQKKPKTEWEDNTDILIGEKYQDEIVFKILEQNVLNYMEFKAEVRNKLMHADFTGVKMSSVLTDNIKITNEKIRNMDISPDAVVCLMEDLIKQLERLGLQ